MLLQRATQLQDVRIAFAHIQSYVEPGGKLHLTDINLHLEDFVCEILNLTFNWTLQNTNKNSTNFPCIDLIDSSKDRKIGVQVTAEKGVKKIRKSHICRTELLPDEVDVLYIFSLLPRQSNYALGGIKNRPRFGKENIFDFNILLLELKKSSDRVLASVHAYVTQQMPGLFQAVRAKDQALYDSITRAVNVLNRDVLHAPARFETPCRMLEAIREMRIELQKYAAIYIASESVANEFKNICDILRSCEINVKREFSVLEKMSPGQQIPPSDYLPGEYIEAIETMMSIRRPIEKSISKIEAERNAVGKRLGH
ncbi:hypothetical protein PIN31115_01919 [Pandoraea iniqua]|uniref:SMEK domain-containing protein n=1 Tax=Pandoraea iniqua TaxID=2508288 RepID=A0A5E4UCV7_9BURK|nr:SMEK domain-containing protein [Pandoraea iniqua]VVD97372.1 hypothetical protein PIN31115_01919 [Pandoraea iniqua]